MSEQERVISLTFVTRGGRHDVPGSQSTLGRVLEGAAGLDYHPIVSLQEFLSFVCTTGPFVNFDEKTNSGDRE